MLAPAGTLRPSEATVEVLGVKPQDARMAFNAHSLRAAAQAGGGLVVAPMRHVEVIITCQRERKVVIPGA